MKDLTREDIEHWCQQPERATIRVSAQVLLEMLDSEWRKPDGSIVKVTRVAQWDDGDVAVTFTAVYPVPGCCVEGARVPTETA